MMKVALLRCRLREGLGHFIRRDHADYLPRLRATVDNFTDRPRVVPEAGR